MGRAALRTAGVAGPTPPSAHCKPNGVPAMNAFALPSDRANARLILVLYEADTVFRQIFLTGACGSRTPCRGGWATRPAGGKATRSSSTRWVSTMGTGWTPGHPHSDGLHLIERFRRPDAGHLEIETTIDDPSAYARPLVYTVKATLTADDDLLEVLLHRQRKGRGALRIRRQRATARGGIADPARRSARRSCSSMRISASVSSRKRRAGAPTISERSGNSLRSVTNAPRQQGSSCRSRHGSGWWR